MGFTMSSTFFRRFLTVYSAITKAQSRQRAFSFSTSARAAASSSSVSVVSGNTSSGSNSAAMRTKLRSPTVAMRAVNRTPSKVSATASSPSPPKSTSSIRVTSFRVNVASAVPIACTENASSTSKPSGTPSRVKSVSFGDGFETRTTVPSGWVTAARRTRVWSILATSRHSQSSARRLRGILPETSQACGSPGIRTKYSSTSGVAADTNRRLPTTRSAMVSPAASFIT